MTGFKLKSKRALTALGMASAAGLMILSLGGCSHLPFVGGKKSSGDANAVASQGERLSIVAFDQKLEPSRSLKGVGYYLPPAAPVESWPLTTGPQGELVQNAAAAKAFQVAWSKSIGVASKGKTEVMAQPVSDGKLIYTLDGEARVSAFDVNSGREAWSVDLNPHNKRDKVTYGGGLAYANGKLYVTSGFRFLVALDPANGKTLWQKTVDTPLHAAPTVTDKYVVVTDVQNQIFAFNIDTGDMGWTYQAIAEPARIMKAPSPVVADNVVYAPFSSGELMAINGESGQTVWEQVLAQSNRTNALSEIRDISGHPVVYNGKVFAASHSGVFQAMDAGTGEPAWTVPVDSVNTPWVAGDVVFLVSLQGELICVNRDSGQIYWLKDLNEGAKVAKVSKGFLGLGKPKIGEDTPEWSGPFMASDRLVMVTSKGQAIALDPKTGNVTNTLNLGGPAYLAPIAVGDKLFVVTDDAKLVAIR
ncbi:MAG TPA: PQQ-binding-like beta-propeller repeat protein [Asticcacaulis sp.]|nr:PQQ-binding-like beta-propeller repeat protein [Asticcacaulis sp.]